MFKRALEMLIEHGLLSSSDCLWGDGHDWLVGGCHRDHETMQAAQRLMEGCTVECAEQFGGEGQGDNIWAVYKITLPDGSVEHYRCNGWYASYDGATYDDTERVYPKEVMKIEWDTKPGA